MSKVIEFVGFALIVTFGVLGLAVYFDENKQMLRRYLYGADTGTDRFDLHGLAITLRGMK